MHKLAKQLVADIKEALQGKTIEHITVATCFASRDFCCIQDSFPGVSYEIKLSNGHSLRGEVACEGFFGLLTREATGYSLAQRVVDEVAEHYLRERVKVHRQKNLF